MDKTQLFEVIKILVKNNQLTKEELIKAYDEGLDKNNDQALARHLSITEILYYIGGAIVIAGIVILIQQNWDILNVYTRIISTLGTAIAAYFIGVILNRDNKLEGAGYAFFLISAVVMPLGLYVVLDASGIQVNSDSIHVLVSSIIFTTFLISYLIFRKSIFVFFTIVYGTSLYFSLTNLFISGNPIFRIFKFDEYRILTAGITYMLLGYYFSRSKMHSLSGFLNGFGVLGFLSASLALGGYSPRQNLFWELLYPFIVFGIMFLSVYIKSKSYLVFSTIFLMVYILKLTFEYFSRGLGWPLALVLAGFTLILIGYATLKIKNKYLA